MRLHRFYNSCQEFESWMEDKENILNTFNSNSDNLGVIQAKYEVKKQNKNLNYYMLIWMSYCVCWNQRFTKHIIILYLNKNIKHWFLFQNFLTQLASGPGQLDDIIRVAQGLVRSCHSKQSEIEARQRKVSNRYIKNTNTLN